MLVGKSLLVPLAVAFVGCSNGSGAPAVAAHDAASDGSFRDASGDAKSSDASDASDASSGLSDASDRRDASVSVELASIVEQYKSWQPQSDTALNISDYIFGLCRAPTLHETEFSTSEHGNGRYLLDWANPAAAEGLQRKGVPAFAVGSAIVKEKLVVGEDGGFRVVALGIMHKRQAGFDPANGDWAYGYWEASSGLLSSPAQASYCGGCHAGTAASDFVFMDDSWFAE